MRRFTIVPALLAASLVLACGGKEGASGADGERGGTLVISTAGEPEHLIPQTFLTLPAKQVSDMLFEQLAQPGPGLSTLGDRDLVPMLAESWAWGADSNSVTFAVRGNARWHDGRPVTAEDVRFSYELFADPAVASPHLVNFPRIDSAVVVDSSHVRFVFGERSPERMFKLTTNLTVLPKHLLADADRARLGASEFASQPVGSGPFRFVRWERGSAIYLEADTARLREKPGLDRLIFRFVGDLNAGTRAVVAGESDFIEATRPEGLAMVTPAASLRPVEYGAFNHGYLLFNTRSPSNRQQPHPILGNRELRRALAMAVDRQSVAKNALDTLYYPSFGPFQRVGWAADSTIAQIPHDLARAGAILDSLGWTMGADGIRARGGQKLALSLQVPSVSPTRRQMSVVLQEQLKQLGVAVTIDALEVAVLLPNLSQGKFDAVIHVQTSDASPAGVAQNWGGADLARSSNYGWYANPRVDSLLALATVAPSVERARPLYREIYETIVQDAPAVFIWEPRTIALVHSRVKFDRLRPDAWWQGIPTWRIPAAERIARDQAGK